MFASSGRGGRRPLDPLYPLNRSEQNYLAIDGLAGSIIQPYLLRLSAPVDEAVVRQALRELRRFYPKKAMPRVGNYVASFLVTEQGGQREPGARMASIDAQIKEGLGRFMRRGDVLEPVVGRNVRLVWPLLGLI